MPTLHSIVSGIDEPFEVKGRRCAFEADSQLNDIRERLSAMEKWMTPGDDDARAEAREALAQRLTDCVMERHDRAHAAIAAEPAMPCQTDERSRLLWIENVCDGNSNRIEDMLDHLDAIRACLDALEAKAAPAPDTVAVPVSTLETLVNLACQIKRVTAYNPGQDAAAIGNDMGYSNALAQWMQHEISQLLPKEEAK